MALERRRIIFVGGISASTTEEEIQGYFQQFGSVVKARIMREKKTKEPKGYAYVTMRDSSLVPYILSQCHSLGGRRVDCQLASRKGEKKHWKDEQRKRRIFVANLQLDMDTYDLQKIFSVYGEIRISYVICDFETKLSKGYGYVEFMHPESAVRALQAFEANSSDDAKIQCLPYLGRHEQRIERNSFDRLNAYSQQFSPNSPTSETEEDPLDQFETETRPLSRQHGPSKSPGLFISTDMLEGDNRWFKMSTRKPILHITSNLRFNFGRQVFWSNSTKSRNSLIGNTDELPKQNTRD